MLIDCTRTHTRARTHTHTNTCAHTYTHTQARVRTCTHTRIPVFTQNTHTHERAGGYHEEHPVVVAFWEALRSFSPAEQRALLKFTTACSRAPLLGFK